MSRNDFEVGKKYIVTLKSGTKLDVYCSKLTDDKVELGSNDDLAGRWFTFDEIVSVKKKLF